MKSKPLSTSRGLNHVEDEESGRQSRPVNVEMKGDSIFVNYENDDYYYEDPSNIHVGSSIIFLIHMFLLSHLHTLVTGCNDIYEDDFPDHVKQMHQDKDHKFELEYKVSHGMLIAILMCCSSLCL